MAIEELNSEINKNLDELATNIQNEYIKIVDTYEKEYLNVIENEKDQVATQVKLQKLASELAKKEMTSQFLRSDLVYFVRKNGAKERIDYWYRRNVRHHYIEQHDKQIKDLTEQFDYDLVRVSYHDDSSSLCAPFQNKILSMTGQMSGYMTLDQAKTKGFRHVNCRHTLEVYIVGLSMSPEELEQEFGKPLSKKELEENYQQRQEDNYNRRRIDQENLKIKKAEQMGVSDEELKAMKDKRNSYYKKIKDTNQLFRIIKI